ncbi:bifunctional 4-hydroxy-2-oxoglutarate aldolase/2-dehydro-3-deoxy-phosphogluconate aldolase [Thermoflexus hugenholtzii]
MNGEAVTERAGGILEAMAQVRVIPVATLESEAEARILADALQEAGIPLLEVTFRTAAAAAVIRYLRRAHPLLRIGAGTILSLEQAEQAVAAGAEFLVSPGWEPELGRWCRERGILLIPGVATPSEVMAAWRQGWEVLKFFPAEAMGGVRTLEALAPVFPQVRFIPTGGIQAQNLRDYLRLPNVLACAGTWLADRRLIREGQKEELIRRAREARALAGEMALVS